MSKLFFDHLIVLEKIDLEIKRVVVNPEEREELWKLIDEIVQYHVLICLFEKLPVEDHSYFLDMFFTYPYDRKIIEYLNEKIGEDMEELIGNKLVSLEEEILEVFKTQI